MYARQRVLHGMELSVRAARRAGLPGLIHGLWKKCNGVPHKKSLALCKHCIHAVFSLKRFMATTFGEPL